MTSHACIKICTAKDGLVQKDNNDAAILMNGRASRPDLGVAKQVAKIGYLLQGTDHEFSGA